MKDFVIKTLVSNNIESELEKIGFDISYRAKAADKFRYKTFKIYDLTLPQANILKQTALSFGADCGVHRDVLVNKVEKTDAILGGSVSQIKKICEKLKLQPFSMKDLAFNIEAKLEKNDKKTKIVGILNLTPDSFSNDGIMDSKIAIERMYQLVEDGADMIDIGAESTRPNALCISAEEQIRRLKLVSKEFSKINIPISVDTRSAEVAEFALNSGASYINDVSGLEYDNEMIDIISKYNAGIIIQHSTGEANNIKEYSDVIEEVYKFLLDKSELAKTKNVNKIILDVGICFGKNKQDNMMLLNRIEEFYSLGLPIMTGISRKSFLGVKEDNNDLKDSLTLAINSLQIEKKVDYIRVHNVKLHKQLLDLVK